MDDDQRLVEIETLEAIYPEISRIGHQDADDALIFEIEVPVKPAAPVAVMFPAAATSNDVVPSPAGPGEPSSSSSSSSSGSGSGSGGSKASGNGSKDGDAKVDSLEISHLPSLRLRISLPLGYPERQPPAIHVSAVPPWLRRETLAGLEQDGPRLWEEAGRDMVAFTYIDHVQRLADDVFGTVGPSGALEIDPAHKLAVLDYDINAKKAAFENDTFDCGVCLDPKKGSKCHKMLDCGHIFCLQCLCDFYNDAIEQGYLSTVRCLAPNCAKERAAATVATNGRKTARGKAMTLNPSELLQIGLAEDQVKRYVNLKYKTELESDKNTIYCPRQWCQGAARSKKHKKPSGLEFAHMSEGESDDDGDETTVEGDAAQDADNENHNENDGGGNNNNNDNTAERKKKATESKKFNPADLLAVCEDCGFAFCSRCSQSWHGEFYRCSAKRNKEELSAEEQASLEYLKLHTSPCPTCDAPAQKTHGCNHMICGRCDTHFCYLCSSWLDPVNPYKHYNQPPTSMYGGSTCYMRLWELQEGDGDDVGQGYDGGLEVAMLAEAVDGVREVEMDDNLLRNLNHNVDRDEDEDMQPRRRAPANPRLERRGQVAVAREAPLVLRLMEDPAPNQAVAAAAPPAPAPPNQQQQLFGREEVRPRRGGGRGVPARGRGGRGGAGRPTGAGAIDRGDQPRRRNPQAANGQRDAPRGGALVAEGARRQRQGNDNENGVELDAAQEAWVRNFVQMALMDVEDQIVGDSDSDDNENWLIR